MYCRTCGNKIYDNAEICVNCGVRKNVGSDYCQICGSETTSSMINCKKCGAKLMKALSSTQLKKKAVSKGKKIFSGILLAFGIICLISAVINFALAFITTSRYERIDNLFTSIKCIPFGIFFTILGTKLGKK